MSSRLLRLAAPCTAWLVGCTAWADVDRRQCRADTDCAEAQSGMVGLRCAEGWCIDDGDESSSDDSGGGLCEQNEEALEGSVGVFSATSSALIEGAIVELCRGLDTECAQPVFESTSGPDGVAPLMVPPGFTGYVQVRAEGYIPQLLLGVPPVIDGNPVQGGLDIESPFQTPGMLLFPLVQPQEAAGLALLLGTDYDETRGVVSGNVRGCFGSLDRPLGLVALTDLTGATPWCLVNGLPSSTADTLEEACGYLNAPTGLYSIHLIDRDDGTVLQETSVIVRAGAFTTVRFR